MKFSSLYALLLSGAVAFSAVGGPAFAEGGTVSFVSSARISAAKLPAPKNIRVVRTSKNSIDLKWDTVKGANGFKVYIYDTSKKKYALYKTVKATSCRVSGLKPGTSYTFAVAATAKSGSRTVTQQRSKGLTARTEADRKAVKYALRNYPLKNKTVHILSTFNAFPDDGETAKLFKKVYGGDIVWYPTVEGYHYADLATMIMGGQDIDLFPYYEDSFARGIDDGYFLPIDSYADLSSELWGSVSIGTAAGKVNGKHYLLATEISKSGDVKGFELVKGGTNPDGAARLAECELYLHTRQNEKNIKNMESAGKKAFAPLDERLSRLNVLPSADSPCFPE